MKGRRKMREVVGERGLGKLGFLQLPVLFLSPRVSSVNRLKRVLKPPDYDF